MDRQKCGDQASRGQIGAFFCWKTNTFAGRPGFQKPASNGLAAAEKSGAAWVFAVE
jgi:hypothetical protein